MKFLERALILMTAIGYWLAVLRQPADLPLLLISGLGLAAYYVLMMPLLVGDIPLRELFRKSRLRPAEVVLGGLLGLVYGYGTLSFLFHNLGWMSSRDLAENCGIALSLITIPVFILYRKSGSVFYRRLLLRIGVLALVLGVSLVAHPFLPLNPVVQRMSPL